MCGRTLLRQVFNNSLFPFARALSSGVKTRKLPLITCICSLIQVSVSPLKFPSQVLVKVLALRAPAADKALLFSIYRLQAHAELCRGIGCRGTERNSKRKCQAKFTEVGKILSSWLLLRASLLYFVAEKNMAVQM